MKHFDYNESALAKSIVKDERIERYQTVKVHTDLDQHVIHSDHWAEPRRFDIEADSKADWQKQKNYTKRLAKAQHWSLNAWNHVNPNFVGPLNVSPEVLAILFEPVDVPDAWENQYLNDAYDVAIDTVDDEDFGSMVQIGMSYQVTHTKRWTQPIETDESGKPITSSFNAEKYKAHVKHSAKVKMLHDLPELTDKAGNRRMDNNLAGRIRLVHAANYAGNGQVHSVQTKEEKIAAKLAALDAKRKGK